MKILYLANVRLPTTNAHGLQISKMCEAFASTGAEIRLIIPRRYNSIEADIFSYYGLKKNFQVVVLPTPDLNAWGRIGFWLQNLFFSILAFFYCLFCSNFDLIYSRDELPLFFLSSLFKKKLAWEVHIDRFNFVIRILTSRVLAIISISGGLKHFLEERGVSVDKILISPDAVDPALFDHLPLDKVILRKDLGLPSEKSIITYVGKYTTLNKAKGVDALIEAFSLVYRNLPNSQLLLVGIIETEISKLENFIRKTGIPVGACRLIRHQPHQEAMKYVKASDVLIMNYPDQGHYTLYMSPLKLFEYMASGNVIVSSSLPSIREILSPEEAYLVKPDDVKALADGIYQALTHPEESAQKAKLAAILARQYTWEARANNILKFVCGR